MMYDYDVVFIGSGHACWHGALTLVQAGKKVAIVDGDLPGGTCTNYGCDAKILLDGPFEFLEGLERYKGLCVDRAGCIDWQKLMAYKKQVLTPFPGWLAGMLENVGIVFIRNHGKLLDAHTIQAGEKKITSEYIVIGTGQRDGRQDIPGKEFIHNSREFLDLESIPDRVVFIGPGVISMEFASMVIKLGKKVTIIAHGDRALRPYPAKYVLKLVRKMEADGICFKWNEEVTRVEKCGESYRITTKKGSEIECDYILEATGRVANYENLGLEDIGIQASRRGIVVDDHLRTAVSTIYASGDVVDKKIPKLTPTAEFESNYIAGQILGISDAPICYPVIPNLVFTLPRIGQLGVTLEEAEKNPDKYVIHTIPYGMQNEWVDNRELDADLTYIVDREGSLAGAAIYGSEAGTWLDFLTLIINKNITSGELRNMIFAFPTQTYMIANTLIPILK